MTEENKVNPARATVRTPNSKPERKIVSDGYNSPFHVDPKNIPSDMDYRWVRVEIEGREDGDNIDGALMDGWQPVPPTRHPELVLSLKRDFKPEFIKRSGHILMERPKYVGEERKAMQREMNEQQVNSVNFALDGGTAKDLNLTVDNNKVTRTFQE